MIRLVFGGREELPLFLNACGAGHTEQLPPPPLVRLQTKNHISVDAWGGMWRRYLHSQSED